MTRRKCFISLNLTIQRLMRYNLLIFANNDIFIVYEKILYVATYNNFIIDSGGVLYFPYLWI